MVLLHYDTDHNQTAVHHYTPQVSSSDNDLNFLKMNEMLQGNREMMAVAWTVAGLN